MSTNVLSQRPKKKTPVGKPAPVQAVDEEKRGWSSMFGGLFSTADDTSDPASPAALPTVVAAMFGLPRDTELLDEFYCTHKGSLGKLFVFRTHVGFADYFMAPESQFTIPGQTIKGVHMPKELMNFSIDLHTNQEEIYRFSTFLSRDTAAGCITYMRNMLGDSPGANGYTKQRKRESSVRAKALQRKAEKAQGRRPLVATAVALVATGGALFVGARRAGLQPEERLREVAAVCMHAFRHVRREVQRRLPTRTVTTLPPAPPTRRCPLRRA